MAPVDGTSFTGGYQTSNPGASHATTHRVRNRSLHVHVPRWVHRRAERRTWNGLGDGGQRLHEWAFTGGNVDPTGASVTGINRRVVDEFMSTGAVVAGRGTFEPAGGWGGDHHDGVPIFILTRGEPASQKLQFPLVTYVSDIRTAMTRAKEAAGGKNVLVHGAGTAQLALAAGVLDEVEIHLIPVLFGQGRRLFEGLGPDTSTHATLILLRELGLEPETAEAYVQAIRAYNADDKAARSWPIQFLVRRTAHHVMDHGWEMEDRDLSA